MTSSRPRFRPPSDVRGTARRAAAWAACRPVLPRGRMSSVAAVVALVVVAAGSGTAAAVDLATRVPDGSAFRVGDTTVTVAQLDDRVRLLTALYGVTRPSDPAGSDAFDRSTAKALATSTVLDRAAADRGIVIADKAADDELARLVQTTFPGGRADFAAQLQRLGVTEHDVLDEITRQMANARLYDAVTADVPTPTDDEVAAAYQARRDQMVTPEQRKLRTVVVADEAAARAVRTRLDGGADFATVARESSLDGSTKGRGGDLGTLGRDQLEKPFGDAAFTAPAGSLFGPVQTQHGWNVGQVVAVTPAVPLSLDKVRDALRARLADERRSAVWTTWLDQRIDEDDVRYADAYRPADPHAAPAGP